jgi:hypothetical protein
LPVGPVIPVGPVFPVGPVLPVLPVGPVGPVLPVAPVFTALPGKPVGPVGPVLPVDPLKPVGPVDAVKPIDVPFNIRLPSISTLLPECPIFKLPFTESIQNVPVPSWWKKFTSVPNKSTLLNVALETKDDILYYLLLNIYILLLFIDFKKINKFTQM